MLAEIVLQYERTLNLLYTEQGDAIWLSEKCVVYNANYSEIIRNNLAVLKAMQKRGTKNEINDCPFSFPGSP